MDTCTLLLVQRPIPNRAELIAAYKQKISPDIDHMGKHSGPVQKKHHILGPGNLTHQDLTPTCVGTKNGTAVWDRTVVGQFSIDAGTIWTLSITFDDLTISTYEFGTVISPGVAICFDTSGNGRHLALTGFADVAAACVESMTTGSDWLNQKGWSVSDGEFLSYADAMLELGNYVPESVLVPALVDGSGCAAYLSDVDLLPADSLVFRVMMPSMVDDIGLSISDKASVRAEIWALFFDGSDVAYSDAQRIINIEASFFLNCGLELGGSASKGYFLYPIGTADTVLAKAYRWAGEIFESRVFWYVAEVGGDDLDDGLSLGAAFATLTKLTSVLQANQSVLLAGGHWRETLAIPADGVRLYTYGSNIIDGADVATGWAQDVTYTNTYKIVDTLPDSQVNLNQAVWEDGVVLQGVASAALCDSTPGSFYYTPVTADVPYTIYIHPTGSTDPAANGKVYEISKRGYCLISTLDYDDVQVFGALRVERGYSNGGVLRLAGVRQYADNVDCYSESLHTVYLSQGEMHNIKTTTSNLPGGANDIVFIQSPPLVEPSRSLLSDFECVGNGNRLNQALLIHTDATKRCHFKNGTITNYAAGSGAGGLEGNSNITIFENVDFRNIKDCCVDLIDVSATASSETYFINCILTNTGFFPLKITNLFPTSKVFIYGSLILSGSGYGIYLNGLVQGLVRIDSSIICRKTQGQNGIVGGPSGAGIALEVYNSILFGFEDIYTVEAAGSTFAGNFNIYNGQTRISHPWIANNSYPIEDWKTYSGQDANSVSADPLFTVDPRTIDIETGVFDYTTQAGSPAKTLFAGIADKPATYTAPAWVDSEVAAIVNY